jgi:excisionase family DNA binding protein
VKAPEPKLLRVSRAAHELGLYPVTVRKWIKAGKIQAIRVGKEARIPRAEIERLAGTPDGRLIVVYGRVSGHGHQSDLDTQLERLHAWAKAQRAEKQILVLSDIGSGLSASRRQLRRLLRLVRADQVAEIAVTGPDRLIRFGHEYLQVLFDCFGVTLTVLDSEQAKRADQELADDLLAVLASFSGRLYGKRPTNSRNS